MSNCERITFHLNLLTKLYNKLVSTQGHIFYGCSTGCLRENIVFKKIFQTDQKFIFVQFLKSYYIMHTTILGFNCFQPLFFWNLIMAINKLWSRKFSIHNTNFLMIWVEREGTLCCLLLQYNSFPYPLAYQIWEL